EEAMPNYTIFNLEQEAVIIIFGGTDDSTGIGITTGGHIVHIPGNNPEVFRQASALVVAATSLAEQAQHVPNAQLRQRMGEFAVEMGRTAAGSLKPLVEERSSSQRE